MICYFHQVIWDAYLNLFLSLTSFESSSQLSQFVASNFDKRPLPEGRRRGDGVDGGGGGGGKGFLWIAWFNGSIIAVPIEN